MRVKLYIGSVFLGIAAIVITAAACTASSAAAEDQPPKSGKDSAAEPLPLSKLIDYVENQEKNTTIKNKRIWKGLAGRVYKGEVEVDDVRGDDDEKWVSISAGVRGTNGSWMADFQVQKPDIVKKAADLPKGAKVIITARLIPAERAGRGGFGGRGGGGFGGGRGINIGGTPVLSFNDTQAVEIVPSAKLSPKK